MADAARSEGTGACACQRAEGEIARRQDQLLVTLHLELAPGLSRTLRQPHVVRIGIGEAEDPRGAVARATAVTHVELFEEDDTTTCLGQRPGRRNPHDSCPDDDYLSVDRPRGAGGRYGAIPRAVFDAACARAL